MICVITVFLGHLSYKNLTKANHEAYCARHHYTYVCIEEALSSCHPMWLKPELLLWKLQEGFDYVF